MHHARGLGDGRDNAIEVAGQRVELRISREGRDARGGDSFGRDAGILLHEVGESSKGGAAGDEQKRRDGNLGCRQDDANAVRAGVGRASMRTERRHLAGPERRQRGEHTGTRRDADGERRDAQVR